MQDADHILIPLLDGQYTLAQVARTDDDAALLYVTHRRMTLKSEVFAFTTKDIRAAVFVAPDAARQNDWPVVGYEAIPDLYHTRRWTLSDTDRTIQDAAVVEALANALHGLYPWDGFPDPDFFTNLLANPDVLPKRARMAADFPDPT